VRSLEVVLTTACNQSCAYCFQDVRTGQSMSWRVLRRALDLLLRSDHPHPELTFYGGEPLLELPLMMRAIEYLEADSGAGGRVAVSVFTNGTLLDRGTRRFLARHGVDTQLSLDGVDGVEAAQHLRAPGTFDRLDRALSRLRDEHPGFLRDRCSVAITLSSRNLEHLAESFGYLVDRGVGEIVVSALVTHDSGWRPSTIEALADQIDGILDVSIEHFKRTGEVPFAPFKPAEPADLPTNGPPAMCTAAGRRPGLRLRDVRRVLPDDPQRHAQAMPRADAPRRHSCTDVRQTARGIPRRRRGRQDLYGQRGEALVVSHMPWLPVCPPMFCLPGFDRPHPRQHRPESGPGHPVRLQPGRPDRPRGRPDRPREIPRSDPGLLLHHTDVIVQ
jgi:hypothetical protein